MKDKEGCELEARKLVSLYIHLPFCRHKCAYCHFYVLPDKADLKTLLMEGLELEWKKSLPLLANRLVHTIYFGGGTPWLMGPHNIAKILEWIKSNVSFSSTCPEITLEANPEDMDAERMAAFAAAGINRLSIGVQTLDPNLLKVLTRQHSAEKAIEAVHIANRAGIKNISIDLMYDLPSQTLDSWKKTLAQIKDLPISHLSLYNLTIEPHTVFFKQKQKLLKQVPDEETSLAMYETAVEMLQQYGLEQYEISAFARNKHLSQHNTGYWEGRSFLGLGPSAFSDWEGKRFQNVANLNQYVKTLKAGDSPVDFSERLIPIARRRELLAIQLRLLRGVDLTLFQAKNGRLDAELLTILDNLNNDGFLIIKNNLACLTKKGVLFYDTVAAEIVY